MRGAQSISTRRAYGVQRICRVWERCAVQRLRTASRDEVTCAAVSPRAGRCRPGRGASRPHPPAA